MSKINVLIQPLLIEGLHIDSIDIRKLFWDVKMENGVFGLIQKNWIQNGHAFKNAAVDLFYIKTSTVNNSKSKLCTGIFNFLNVFTVVF